MTDESYACIEDIRDRKRVARGIHNKRTHNGKGGRVKTPSDYLTRKERTAMNGECISYRLNEPLTWEVLKTYPKDIQKQYLELIRNRYHPTKQAVQSMLGINEYRINLISKEFCFTWPKGGAPDPDKDDAFLAWWRGLPLEIPEDLQAPMEEVRPEEEPQPEPARKMEPSCMACKKWPFKAPQSGRIVMHGTPDEIAETIANFLGDREIHCTVEWEVIA